MYKDSKKPRKLKISKNYLPSAFIATGDKTNIDAAGCMHEEPSINDVLKEKIEPQPPHAPSL